MSNGNKNLRHGFAFAVYNLSTIWLQWSACVCVCVCDTNAWIILIFRRSMQFHKILHNCVLVDVSALIISILRYANAHYNLVTGKMNILLAMCFKLTQAKKRLDLLRLQDNNVYAMVLVYDSV